MRGFFALMALLAFACLPSFAQSVTEGSFESLRGVRRCKVQYDISHMEIQRGTALKKDLQHDQDYCLGSINSELDGKIRLGDFANADVTLLITIKSIRANLDSPVASAAFVDKDGKVLVAFGDFSDDDLNDVGHKIGKFVYRQIRKF